MGGKPPTCRGNDNKNRVAACDEPDRARWCSTGPAPGELRSRVRGGFHRIYRVRCSLYGGLSGAAGWCKLHPSPGRTTCRKMQPQLRCGGSAQRVRRRPLCRTSVRTCTSSARSSASACIHQQGASTRPADGCTHSTALENPRPHRSGPRGCSTDRLRARVAQPAALGALQLRSLVAEHSQWQRSASQSAGSTASLATAAIGPASGVGVISGVTVCRSERVGSGTRVVADTLAVVDGTIPCASMSSCGPSPAAHA